MKTATRLVAALAALLAGAHGALADPPPASFQLDFDGESSIWNPFDGVEACENMGLTFGLTFDYDSSTACLELDDVVCNGKGSCAGTATMTFVGQVEGTLTGPFESSAKCKEQSNPNKPMCSAKLAFDVEGPIRTITMPLGLTCDGEFDGKVNGPVDSTGFFAGWANAKACAQCAGGGRRVCESIREPFDYDVNPPTPWSLMVEVAPNGSKLEGTAQDTLGYSYTAKGSYNQKKDESNLTLSGEKGTESNGAKIILQKLVTTGSDVTDGTAKISVQGNQSTAELGP